MWHESRPKRRPFKLKPKWYPEQNVFHRPQQLAGRTARDIVDAAWAIKNDEMEKRAQRSEANSKKRRKAKIAAVSLKKMPWGDE